MVGTWDVEDIVVSIRRLSGMGQLGERGQYQAKEQSLELEYLIVSGSLAHSHGIKSHDDRGPRRCHARRHDDPNSRNSEESHIDIWLGLVPAEQNQFLTAE